MLKFTYTVGDKSTGHFEVSMQNWHFKRDFIDKNVGKLLNPNQKRKRP